MSLCANPNDPHLVGPVFVPSTGLSFRYVDAAPSGKTNIQRAYFLGGNLWQKNHKSFSIRVSADNWTYHTFTGILDYHIQAVTY